MTTTLIVPGLHSSGPDHWQTWLESELPSSVRVIQRDWRDAYLPDWSARVRREIDRHPGEIVIVAHSFGVLAAVQAANDYRDRVAAALLVAPADPDAFQVSEHLPAGHLGFRSVVVASTNDPWMRLARAAQWADIWGADLINLGASGHINAEAGFGPWPEGRAILERLRHASFYDRRRLDAESSLLRNPARHARRGRERPSDRLLSPPPKDGAARLRQLTLAAAG